MKIDLKSTFLTIIVVSLFLFAGAKTSESGNEISTAETSSGFVPERSENDGRCQNIQTSLKDDDEDYAEQPEKIQGQENEGKDSLVNIPYDTFEITRIVIGGGCFWCTQAMFQRLKGVEKVESGYAGGHSNNPTYYEVKSQQTGHAQVISVTFNPKIIRYETLLYIFMHVHDPTTLNRQGIDVGTQYRSIILYSNEKQRIVAEAVLEQVRRNGQYQNFPAQIVTELKKFDVFYPAEEYHHDYYDLNPKEEECNMIIAPKIGKLKKLFHKYVDHSKN